jgi:predicted SprT family Zn-dependent metalloprotease
MKLELEHMIAESQVIEACDIANQSKLADKIKIEWSNRAITRLGSASRLTYTITLALKSWPLLPFDERKETVYHETAHLIALHEGGLDSWGHTSKWKEVMRRLGYKNPESCHSVISELAPIRRRVKRVVAKCLCSYSLAEGTHRSSNGDHFITEYKAKRIKAGDVYVCRSCSSELKPTDKIVVV